MMKKILAILCIVTLFASIAASAYAAEDDGIIVSLQDFEDDTSISTNAQKGWKIQGNGSAEITSDGNNNFVKFVPSTGSSKPELMYLFDSTSAGKSVRLTFKTKLDGTGYTKRIGLRSGSTIANYAFFHKESKIQAGSSAKGLGNVEDYTFKSGVWYDATVDINPATGYARFTLFDGESTFVTQGISSTIISGGITGIIVNSDNISSSGNAWYIDDVKLEELSESVSAYDAKTIMINNEKFTYMPENQELVGTTTEKWVTFANKENGASVKIMTDNANKFASVKAGSSSYTEFKRTFTSFTKAAVSSIQLDFSMNFADKNHTKSLYITGSEDKSYITFDTDGKVYIGNAGVSYDRNEISNFVYDVDKWYDFSYKLNTQTGLCHISVKDGDKIYGALAKDTYTNDDFTRIGFVVDNKMPEGTTTSFRVDNIHMQQIDTFNMDYVNISDVTYSADTLEPGTISASLTGQVYGKTEYTLYLAIYTKGQKELVEVDVVPVRAEGFDKTFTAQITVPKDGNSYEVRAFLFDKDLTPVQTLEALQ